VNEEYLPFVPVISTLILSFCIVDSLKHLIVMK